MRDFRDDNAFHTDGPPLGLAESMEEREDMLRLDRLAQEATGARSAMHQRPQIRPGMRYSVRPELLKDHPVAELFPLLEGDDWTDFLADFETNGQREPVKTYCGLVLDGRNRRLAAETLKRDLVCEEVKWQAGKSRSFTAYVVSLNLRRRHMSVAQRAAVAADLADLMRKELEKSHKSSHATQHSLSTRKEVSETIANQQSVRPTEISAAQMGVHERKVYEAGEVKRAAPGVFDVLRQGGLSLSAARAAVDAPPDVQQNVVASALAGDRPHASAVKKMADASNTSAVKDQCGRPLPREVVTGYLVMKRALEDIAFRCEESRKQWERAVRDVQRREKGKADPARQVTGALSKEAREALSVLASAPAALRAAVPFSLCPHCRGAAVDDGGGCRGCRGAGWVAEDVYNAAPAELRDFRVPVEHLKEHR